MGIRYYAYAFDHCHTEAALARPHAFVSDDPLADAWGFEPHARVAVASFEQSVPERDLLYLDKAWSHLQGITEPGLPDGVARPAYRMFEGGVEMHAEGWEPWIRAITPAEVATIAPDVMALDERLATESFLAGPDREYIAHYLRRAAQFVTRLAAERRGMVYIIR